MSGTFTLFRVIVADMFVRTFPFSLFIEVSGETAFGAVLDMDRVGG